MPYLSVSNQSIVSLTVTAIFFFVIFFFFVFFFTVILNNIKKRKLIKIVDMILYNIHVLVNDILY